MSEKGQVVIPRNIRATLKIKPGTRFAVYAKNNTIFLNVVDVLDPEKEQSRIFKSVQAKNLKLGEKEVYDAIRACRAKKRK